MKKMKWLLPLTLVLAPMAVAQEMTDEVLSEYVVRPGDNLWKLAELKLSNPEEWKWLILQNRFLQEPGRAYTRADGTYVVRIYPGERLYGLEEVGVNLAPSNPVMNELIDEDSAIIVTSPKRTIADFLGENWWWLLLLLLGGGFLLWFLRELSKDPVRSGAPQVTGGVNNETIRDELQRRGSTQGFTLIPNSIVRGRGYGRMMVSYHGGAEHPRNLNGETIYRARASFEDGREEDIFMLQGCGNDVRYGGAAYRLFDNFRFDQDQTITEPSAEPIPEEAVVTSSAATESTVDFDGELPLGTIHGSIQGPRNPGDKAVLRIQGASLNGLTFMLSDRDLTFRWLPDDAE